MISILQIGKLRQKLSNSPQTPKPECGRVPLSPLIPILSLLLTLHPCSLTEAWISCGLWINVSQHSVLHSSISTALQSSQGDPRGMWNLLIHKGTPQSTAQEAVWWAQGIRLSPVGEVWTGSCRGEWDVHRQRWRTEGTGKRSIEYRHGEGAGAQGGTQASGGSGRREPARPLHGPFAGPLSPHPAGEIGQLNLYCIIPMSTLTLKLQFNALQIVLLLQLIDK